MCSGDHTQVLLLTTQVFTTGPLPQPSGLFVVAVIFEYCFHCIIDIFRNSDYQKDKIFGELKRGRLLGPVGQLASTGLMKDCFQENKTKNKR